MTEQERLALVLLIARKMGLAGAHFRPTGCTPHVAYFVHGQIRVVFDPFNNKAQLAEAVLWACGGDEKAQVENLLVAIGKKAGAGCLPD